MTNFLTNPAFWASLTGLLAAFGIEVRYLNEMAQIIMEAIAIVTAVIGILFAARDAKEE